MLSTSIHSYEHKEKILTILTLKIKIHVKGLTELDPSLEHAGEPDGHSEAQRSVVPGLHAFPGG